MKHVFGIVGAGNAHIFDSVYQHPDIELVCVHHEQAGTMAMQTYFRTRGVITATILTTGAGSSNGITGVLSAWADSIPGLVISGNENSKYIRPDNQTRMYGVQGYDSTFMVSKITKYAARVMDPKHVLFELEKAHFIAGSGRPGPCWIDVPMNIQSSTVEETDLVVFDPAELRVKDSTSASRLTLDVQQVLSDLRAAQRPVVWLGHGIRMAGGESLLSELLERLPAAYLVSWSGIDMVNSNHPLLFGRAGVYGQRCANFVLQNADYVLAIGTRLAIPQIGYDTNELARGAKMAVVDIDPSELEKHSERFNHPICSDARAFITDLLQLAHRMPVPRPAAWLTQCQKYRNEFPWVAEEHTDLGGFINSYAFMDRLNAHLKPNQFIVTDMGTALLSGHQVLRIRNGQRLMTSLGLGEMGYGLPAAIGVSFARDRGEVLCLNCDGGMMLNLQELQTIAHHALPVKIIIFNNDGYLMIKHTQNAILGGRYSGTDKKSGVSCPDFSKVGKAFDMPTWQIRTWEDFDRVMPEFQNHAGPAICEVFMHPEQLFVPKLSLAPQADGSLVSPPLEDLSPLLPKQVLRDAMRGGIHPKSELIRP
ncbi:MAG: thiamine pyrophosphate-binding protein [Pedosphaera sp.]|nr:thiamine pyrophosphate-binding protein [Pedosphaera sp.]